MPEDRSEAPSGEQPQNPTDREGASGGEAVEEATDGRRASEENRPAPHHTREDRPDIRAAKTETAVRRWALLLLVLIPAAYFMIQKLLS